MIQLDEDRPYTYLLPQANIQVTRSSFHLQLDSLIYFIKLFYLFDIMAELIFRRSTVQTSYSYIGGIQTFLFVFLTHTWSSLWSPYHGRIFVVSRGPNTSVLTENVWSRQPVPSYRFFSFLQNALFLCRRDQFHFPEVRYSLLPSAPGRKYLN